MEHEDQQHDGGMDLEITRRQLISGAGKIVMATAVVGVGGLSLARSASSAAAQANVEEYCRTAELEFTGQYPWPYKKIDPDLAADIAYRNWYKGFCSYASISGIVTQLKMEVGEPWKSLPLPAFSLFHGGAMGWGTLCGTLTGASIAASFAAGHKADPMVNDLLNWYSVTELPLYTPSNPKATFKNVNASNSPLCHISVGKWMKKEGVTFGSPERKDRCARLSASVAKKMAEMLNAWHAGTYTPAYTKNQVAEHGITAQNNCTECHGG
jgi:hypothetical protein